MNPLKLFGGGSEPPLPPADPRALALRAIRAYHLATRHDFHRYAFGPSDLDWDTQPNPFRRYEGAPLLALDHVPVAEGAESAECDAGPRYEDVFGAGSVAAARVDRRSISRLFEDSLALSAWKQYGESRWSLRVNPSSGNLHPTEAHLLCGAIEGLCAAPILAHYAPREHALEVRADVPGEAFRELARGAPVGTFFVGLSSIHWREAWKYGERAYRYCQQDLGHAFAAVAIAAAGLGWRAQLCDDLGNDDLLDLLGLREAHGSEPEEPDCLIAIVPSGDEGVAGAPVAPGSSTLAVNQAPRAFASLALRGRPNALSSDHVEWDAVEAAAVAARKPRTRDTYANERFVLPAPRAVLGGPSELGLRTILRRRRSAVALDGRTSISRAAFERLLLATVRPLGRVLPWAPRVHLGLFVHRVRDVEPGMFVLVRDPAAKPLLQAAMHKPFEWEAHVSEAGGTFGLYRLTRGDVRASARAVSCHQEIAADGVFAVAMLAEYEPALAAFGAWFYPRLHWECGAVGQVLYLEAEAIGVRATGIGCFFDEPARAVFGMDSERWRSLYHFTVGGSVEDARLQTSSPYPP